MAQLFTVESIACLFWQRASAMDRKTYIWVFLSDKFASQLSLRQFQSARLEAHSVGIHLAAMRQTIFWKMPAFSFSVFTFSFSVALLSEESLIHTLSDPTKIFNNQY